MIEDPRCSNVTIKHFCTRLLSDLTAMEKIPFGEDTGKFELHVSAKIVIFFGECILFAAFCLTKFLSINFGQHFNMLQLSIASFLCSIFRMQHLKCYILPGAECKFL